MTLKLKKQKLGELEEKLYDIEINFLYKKVDQLL